jgi:hypothetical protein
MLPASVGVCSECPAVRRRVAVTRQLTYPVWLASGRMEYIPPPSFVGLGQTCLAGLISIHNKPACECTCCTSSESVMGPGTGRANSCYCKMA